MRRFLQFIALALLTLVGPAGAVRTLTGPALVACHCGCGAPSERACACEPTAAQPGSPAPAGSPCQPAPSGEKAANTLPVGLITTHCKSETAAPAPRQEPSPWPSGRVLAAGPARTRTLPARIWTPWEAHWRGGADPQAQLGVFRI